MHPIKYLIDHVMIPIITFFHDHLPPNNYGLAIICLTLVVKSFLFPLMAKQFKSMRVMQKLQPKLKEIQEAHKGEPQVLQAKMMELYKDHNATPFGGCLPILVQIPVLFALYGALTDPALVEKIKNAPAAQRGFLFIQDLLTHGVYEKGLVHWDNLVLIVIFTGTSYLTQKMMTTNPNDPMQRQMLIMAPLMGPLIGWVLPSGVLLYIVASSMITVGQYFVLMRQFPTEPQPEPALSAGPKVVEVKPQSVKGVNGDGAKESTQTHGRRAGRKNRR